jgi:hypothetical protein
MRSILVKKVKILVIVLSFLLVGCFAPLRSSKPHLGQTGFRDIKWGSEISTLTDMEKVKEEKSSNSDLVWYTRREDTLAIGKAKLKHIFYAFWMGTFESVWIDFEGDENFEVLKKELFERFGEVPESVKQFYAWRGKETDMSLSYSKDRHIGTLVINSRKVSEKRRTYEKQKEKEERLKKGKF